MDVGGWSPAARSLSDRRERRDGKKGRCLRALCGPKTTRWLDAGGEVRAKAREATPFVADRLSSPRTRARALGNGSTRSERANPRPAASKTEKTPVRCRRRDRPRAAIRCARRTGDSRHGNHQVKFPSDSILKTSKKRYGFFPLAGAKSDSMVIGRSRCPGTDRKGRVCEVVESHTNKHEGDRSAGRQRHKATISPSLPLLFLFSSTSIPAQQTPTTTNIVITITTVSIANVTDY